MPLLSLSTDDNHLKTNTAINTSNYFKTYRCRNLY